MLLLNRLGADQKCNTAHGKKLGLLLLGVLVMVVTGAGKANAQGTVTNVVVTAGTSVINTTVTAPNPTSVSVGAGASPGTPQPGQEWQLNGPATYSWSASPGQANPSTGPETTVTASFFTPGPETINISCTVTYPLIATDGSKATSTISGTGSASVQVNIGVVWDTGLGVGQYFGTDTQGNSVILRDGLLTAPQDQTKTPPVPAKVGTFPGKTLSFSIESATSLAHKSYPLDDSSHQDYAPNPIASYVWSCSGGQFVTGADASGNPQYASTVTGTGAAWIAPSSPSTCSVTCTITDAPPAIVPPDTGTRGPKTGSAGCTVYILSAGLSVRRVGAVKPDPSDPNHVNTLPADFTSSATVAAGAQSTAEHEADVQVAVTLPDGTPAPAGIPISANGVIVSGGQGPNDPPNNVTATLSLGSGVTDANGLVTFPAAFTSGNRTETTVIEADLGDGVKPTANLTQVWDNGDSGHWNPDISDFYFIYDTPNPLTFSPAFIDENKFSVPITKHSISLTVTGMDVWQWDDTNQDYVFVPDAAPDPSLAWFDPSASADSGGGNYSANLDVASDPNNIVDTVYFDAYDNGVFSNGN